MSQTGNQNLSLHNLLFKTSYRADTFTILSGVTSILIISFIQKYPSVAPSESSLANAESGAGDNFVSGLPFFNYL